MNGTCNIGELWGGEHRQERERERERAPCMRFGAIIAEMLYSGIAVAHVKVDITKHAIMWIRTIFSKHSHRTTIVVQIRNA